jgi:hypothetical protein
MAQLSLGDVMETDSSYTFKFNSDGSFKPSGEELVSRLNILAGTINDVTVGFTGGWEGLFGSGVVVSFTYIDSPAAWTVQQIAQNMEGAMDIGVGNVTFSSALTGRSSIADSGQGDGSGNTPDANKNPLQDLTAYIGYAVIAVVVVLAIHVISELKEVT